jgi:O-antigen ligase
MVVSSLLSEFPGKSMVTTFTITFLILMFFFVQDFVLNERHLQILLVVIAVTFGGASIIGILQFLGFEGAGEVIGNISSYEESGARFSGFQANPNGYGLMLMSGIPFLLFLAINGKRYLYRGLASVFLMTSVASLFLSLSRTFVAGFIVFSATFLLLNYLSKRISRKQFLYLVLLVLFFVVLYSRMPDFVDDRLYRYTFSGQDTSGEERKYILLKGIELLWQNPVFGIGFEAFPAMDSQYSGHLAPGVVGHDTLSAFFTSTGLLGTLMFIFLCYKTFKYLNAAQKTFSASNGYLFNLALTVKAALIAILSTSIGMSIVLERIFWIYLAFAALLYRWSFLTQFKVVKPAAVKDIRPGRGRGGTARGGR